MRNILQRSCLSLLLLLLMYQTHQPLWAMDGTSIAYKVSLSGKIYKKVSFLIEEDIRPKLNFSQAEWFLTTAELNYRINPYLKAGGGYMMLNHYKVPNELRNRYYFYVSASYPIGPFSIAVRERFQSTYKVDLSHPKNYLRTMLTVSLKAGKSAFTPFGYAELFNDTGYKGNLHMDRIRLSAGSDYRLNPHNDLQVYYRYHIFKAEDPVNNKHALGISYSHRF